MIVAKQPHFKRCNTGKNEMNIKNKTLKKRFVAGKTKNTAQHKPVLDMVVSLAAIAYLSAVVEVYQFIDSRHKHKQKNKFKH